MINRIDEQPTAIDHKFYDRRSGKDRRKVHTMVDPIKERRKGDRRKWRAIKQTEFCFKSKPKKPINPISKVNNYLS